MLWQMNRRHVVRIEGSHRTARRGEARAFPTARKVLWPLPISRGGGLKPDAGEQCRKVSFLDPVVQTVKTVYPLRARSRKK